MSQQSPAPGDPAPPPGWQKVELFKAHKKIHARHITGIFQSWRWIMVWVTQLIYYGVPWLQWEGRQAILFDIEARRFYLMGWVLYPQDFIYLTGLLVACAMSLFLFTAAAGRLWCGYACPQTVYSEIFMWVERKCEGDRSSRLRLENSRWTGERLWRSGSKHLIWIAIALWTSFTFVGYFTPVRELGADVLAWNLGPWQMFWLGFYALATWGNAGFMREQVCLYMCPYARFQSAMLDKDSLIITYDVKRGEPRGPIRKSAAAEAPAQGDCIDCGLCVQVCPTGIDIRDGLQYACIGCAACIDACDSVMDRVGRPRGLVRYDTERGLPGASRWAALLARLWRPRILIYTALLTVVAGLVITGLSTRMPLRVDVIRDRTVLARIVDDGRIENVYRLQLMNAREQPIQVQIRAGGIAGLTILGASDTQPAEQLEVSIEPLSVRSLPVRVQLEPGQLPVGQHPMRFEIRSTVDGRTLEILEGSMFRQP